MQALQYLLSDQWHLTESVHRLLDELLYGINGVHSYIFYEIHIFKGKGIGWYTLLYSSSLALELISSDSESESSD